MDLTPNPEAAGFDPARLARIDDHFRTAYVEPGKIAGYQIAVGRRGHLAHRSTVDAVFMTHLIPSGAFDFRGQLRSLVYAAIAD